MRIFLQELRKVARPLPLLILAVLNALSALMFLWYNSYDYIKLDNISGDFIVYDIPSEFMVCADLIGLVGTSLEPEELDDAYRTLHDKYRNEFNEIVKAEPIFAEIGVSDYESYRKFEDKRCYSNLAPEEIEALISGEADYGAYEPFDPEADYSLPPNADEIYYEIRGYGRGILRGLDYRLKFIDTILKERYELLDELKDIEYDYVPGYAINAIHKLIDSGAKRDIFPGYPFMREACYVFMVLAIMIMLTVCLLFAPVLTRDNMTGVRSLQYSSKTGRKVEKIQLCAMLSAAFLIAAVEIGAVFALFLNSPWKYFLDCRLNSFINSYAYSWFPGTFGQYLLCMAGLILAVSIGAALIIFMLSRASKNYISLLLCMIPALAFLIFLCAAAFIEPFSIMGTFSKPLFGYIPVPYIEGWLCGLLLLGGAVTVAAVLKRQKRAEVV